MGPFEDRSPFAEQAAIGHFLESSPNSYENVKATSLRKDGRWIVMVTFDTRMHSHILYSVTDDGDVEENTVWRTKKQARLMEQKAELRFDKAQSQNGN